MRKGSKASHDRGGRGQPFVAGGGRRRDAAPDAILAATPLLPSPHAPSRHRHRQATGALYQSRVPRGLSKLLVVQQARPARAHDRRAGADRRQRHQLATLALDSLEEVFSIDPDTLHGRFLAHAPRLAPRRPRKRCAARLEAGEIDAIVVSTCTGYLCPGLPATSSSGSAFAPTSRPSISSAKAAPPRCRTGSSPLAARGGRRARAVRCVEVSSAAMYLDNDPGVLISACLFGDGAGAAVLSREPTRQCDRIEWKRSARCSIPREREALRFEQRGGMLRNVLTRGSRSSLPTTRRASSTTCSTRAGVDRARSPRGSCTRAAATCCSR